MALFLFFSFVSALFALEALERARFIEDRYGQSKIATSEGQYQRIATSSFEESRSKETGSVYNMVN